MALHRAGSGVGGTVEIREKAAQLFTMADLVTPMAIRSAAELRLADHLDKGPATVAEAAAGIGADTRALGVLLDHLDALGIVEADDAGRYSLAPLGEPLTSRWDHLGIRPRLDPTHISGRTEMAMTALVDTVRTGAAAYEAAHGDNLWNDLEDGAAGLDGAAEPAFAEAAFDAGLVVDSYDWSGVSTVVDVGGNDGALLQRLLTAHPHLRGVLFDLERSARAARDRFRREGLADRAQAVAGSFFDSLPAGADVYLLSAVLADWNDEDCLRILRNCARAAGPDGHVLVAEVHMRPPASSDPVERTRTALWLEASMERPDREVGDLEALARAAGTDIVRSGPHTSSRSLLVLRAGR